MLERTSIKDNVCRICMVNINVSNQVNVFVNAVLLETLRAICPAEVKIDKNDLLPLYICLMCKKKISKISVFRKQIAISYKYFQLKLQNSDTNRNELSVYNEVLIVEDTDCTKNVSIESPHRSLKRSQRFCKPSTHTNDVMKNINNHSISIGSTTHPPPLIPFSIDKLRDPLLIADTNRNELPVYNVINIVDVDDTENASIESTDPSIQSSQRLFDTSTHIKDVIVIDTDDEAKKNVNTSFKSVTETSLPPLIPISIDNLRDPLLMDTSSNELCTSNVVSIDEEADNIEVASIESKHQYIQSRQKFCNSSKHNNDVIVIEDAVNSSDTCSKSLAPTKSAPTLIPINIHKLRDPLSTVATTKTSSHTTAAKNMFNENLNFKIKSFLNSSNNEDTKRKEEKKDVAVASKLNQVIMRNMKSITKLCKPPAILRRSKMHNSSKNPQVEAPDFTKQNGVNYINGLEYSPSKTKVLFTTDRKSFLCRYFVAKRKNSEAKKSQPRKKTSSSNSIAQSDRKTCVASNSNLNCIIIDDDDDDVTSIEGNNNLKEKLIVSAEIPNKELKPSAVLSNVQNNDHHVIQELLSSSISDSIIITDGSNDQAKTQTNSSTPKSHNLGQTRATQESSSEHGCFPCLKCPRKFSSTTYLQRHMEYHELNIVQFETRTTTYNVPASNVSEANNVKEKPPLQEVNTVHKTYSRLENLKKEVNNSTVLSGESTVTERGCKFCNVRNPNYRHGFHLYLKHNKSNEDLTETCQNCSEKLMAYELRKHIEKVAKIKRRREKNTCTKCSKQFMTSAALKRHFKIHEPKFHCSLCNQSFMKIMELRTHMKTVHKSAVTRLCSICGKMISYKTFYMHYKNHMKKSIKCVVEGCNATHCCLHNNMIRIKGTAENRTYMCEQCGKSLSSTQGLRRHFETHMDSSSFKYGCPQCKSRFSLPAYLKKHMKIHIRDTIFYCPCCEKGFAYKPVMEKHILKWHGDSEQAQAIKSSKPYKQTLQIL